MSANGADFGSLLTHYKVTAVAAFPHYDACFFKNSFGFYIFKQLAVTFFMCMT